MSRDAGHIEFEAPFGNSTGNNSNSNNGNGNSPSPDGNGLSRIQAGLPPLNFQSQRRGSVSAESYNPTAHGRGHRCGGGSSCSSSGLTPPATTTTTTGGSPLTRLPQEMRERIETAVRSNLLFRSLDAEERNLIFAGMRERTVTAGEVVIRQGEEGDNFYVVDQGRFSVDVNGREMVQIGPGGSFGELALMYNTQRAATVRALEDGRLFAVDRNTFRRVIIDLAYQKRCRYMGFLRTVPLLATLSESEIGCIADALEPCSFPPGTPALRQGDPGDAFYIIVEGEAAVERDGHSVGTLHPGDYFGELALLNRQPRAATVSPAGSDPLKCVSLNTADFVRLLGPLQDILKRNEEHYARYKQYLVSESPEAKS